MQSFHENRYRQFEYHHGKKYKFYKKTTQAWRLHLEAGESSDRAGSWENYFLQTFFSHMLVHSAPNLPYSWEPWLKLELQPSAANLLLEPDMLETWSSKFEALDSYSSDNLYWISSFIHPKTILCLKEDNILWSWVTGEVGKQGMTQVIPVTTSLMLHMRSHMKIASWRMLWLTWLHKISELQHIKWVSNPLARDFALIVVL